VHDPAVGPRPTDETVDHDETIDLAGSTGAPAQLTARELEAWDDLHLSLSRAAADLRRVTGRTPLAAEPPAPPRAPPAAARPAAPSPVPIEDVTRPAAAPVPTVAAHPAAARAPGRRRVALVALGVLLPAAGLVVVLTTSGGRHPSQPPSADPPQAAAPAGLTPSAVTWLRASTGPGTRVAVPAGLRDQVTAALPGVDVRGYGAVGHVDLIVTRTADPGAAAGLALTVPVAALGEGLELRQLLAPGTDWTAEQDARRAAGRELLQNDALSFTRASRPALRQGEVDSRLMTMLAGLALEHRVRVDLPVPPGQVAGSAVRLAADVLRVDGRPLVDYPWGAATVKAFLSVQSTTFIPADVTVARTGAASGALSIRYLLPSPTGVLGGAGFPIAQ
jgi:hypothetical protein